MKKRIIKMFKKAGLKDYAKTWSTGKTFEASIIPAGYCNEWTYYEWAGIKIHFNVETDKLTIFVDNKAIEE